jgi:Heliorhodopsin
MCFLQAIIFILFALDACFAIVQILQFARVRGFRGFAHAEFAYIILSLTSKQLLAWIEFGGAQSLKP